MSPSQQPSIRSFFQPRRQPEYAAPPSAAAPPQAPDAPRDDTNVDDSKPTATAQQQSASMGSMASQPPPAAPPLPPPTATTPTAITIPVTLPPGGIPVLPSPPSLPVGASIVPLEEHHIPALRRINSLLLPVAYPDSFYAKALEPLASGLFSRAILWQDAASPEPKVIGGLVCRLEPNPFLDARTGLPLPPTSTSPHTEHRHQRESLPPPDTPYHAIYIQSLALLSPYRSLGLAAAALEHIVASADLLPAAGSSIDARTIYAHVWTENEDGLAWYEARGFSRTGREPVKGYYFKLRPDTAWVVKRDIGPRLRQPLSSSSFRQSPLTSSSSSSAPPPPQVINSTVAAAANLPPPPASVSYQNSRPETEWNDLPADMVIGNSAGGSTRGQQYLSPGGSGTPGSAAGSAASSRSSSTARKKRERAYPSAAFGS